MTPEQQRLTREQWRALEIREECARRQHEPYQQGSRRPCDPIDTWACECGDVTWTPTTKEAK